VVGKPIDTSLVFLVCFSSPSLVFEHRRPRGSRTEQTEPGKERAENNKKEHIVNDPPPRDNSHRKRFGMLLFLLVCFASLPLVFEQRRQRGSRTEQTEPGKERAENNKKENIVNDTPPPDNSHRKLFGMLLFFLVCFASLPLVFEQRRQRGNRTEQTEPGKEKDGNSKRKTLETTPPRRRTRPIENHSVYSVGLALTSLALRGRSANPPLDEMTRANL